MERIDIHAHCVPPTYREYCLKNDFAGRGHPDGMGCPPFLLEWDAKSYIQLLKELNITKSVLSMSSPGTHLTPGNDEEARSLTRSMNEDMAKICAENKDQFLFFASLPLPDVKGSLTEINYALDHLGAVGFQILTNSHGIYPGDPQFSRVFDKLSERKTIVFLHPTTCHTRNPQTGSVEKVAPLSEVPSPIMEFMFDTTRSLAGLFTSGTVTRCSGITFLVCHCGATFPPIMQRIAEFSTFMAKGGDAVSGNDIKELLNTRFYIDLAGLPFPDQIHGLLRLVDSSRLLYGSDYPYTPAKLVTSLAERVDGGMESLFGTETTKRVPT
ncbi:Amidohydrolase 2 [Penicillium maclennaniae]|uniref:Amidohydrolase 2 n=1 Tax=Penicillium maclennaniae TaxID=1343394 RepID=UPI002541EAA2|nr:Amidohydrolase 2 [Penicillium maclennaniae]KAJ5678348.1 Amidohydrolase 2 [Penicillium maclennaniae]